MFRNSTGEERDVAMKGVGKTGWVAVLAALLVLGSSAAVFAEGTKIAVLDLKRCLTESKKGKQLGTELVKKRDELLASARQKEAELKKLIEEYDRQKGLLSDNAKKDKEKEFEAKRKKFQEFLSATEAEMRKSSEELTDIVVNDLKDIVTEIATRNGYDIILNRDGLWLVYAATTLDITDEVIRAYDAKAGGK